MIPQILQPTCVTDHSATLIHNIFINSVNYHTISGNLLADLSDHFPNFLILNKYTSSNKTVVYKRDYTNCDMSALVNEMNMVDWSITLSQNNDVNAMFDSFYLKISQVIDKHVPLKKLTKNEIKFNSKPWITPGLKVSIRKKNRLFKKYCLNKNSYSALKYKKYRKRLNKLLALSKKSYYQNYFKNNTSNVKKIWSGMKELLKLKSKGMQTAPYKLLIGDREIIDSVEMANAFNDYFSNIGCEITSLIPSVNKSLLNYLNKSCESSFFLSPATVEEIELEILKLNISKSVGPYSIPTCLIKCLYSCLSRPLADLYNCSFQCGIVPDKFKVARVIPIFKSGDQTCLGNY